MHSILFRQSQAGDAEAACVCLTPGWVRDGPHLSSRTGLGGSRRIQRIPPTCFETLDEDGMSKSSSASVSRLFLLNSWTYCAIKPRIFEPRIFDKEATGFGPIFEEEPLDTVYAEDSPENKISMNCRVRANPPAIIKWWLNNWEIKLMEQPDDHYSLVGGNLLITNPDKAKHAGKYVCVAKNVYGTVFSKEAIVKFGYLNQFPTDEREPVNVKEGQGAVLLCSPPSRYPSEVLFRWIYNDFPNFILPDQRRFVSQSTGNLYIAKVEASDVGNYSCFVSSPVIGKSVFSMPIALIPQIEKEEKRYPADIRVKFPKTYALVHQNLTLECFALGK
ncbi:hypothetical protein DNTS_006117 [Danionella cerebrum]|uniref:Ig-like domain-containing protein n=1 Tax=Danionella cerebrum TaxID=2873325 RepID=A0A553NR95_9TELE|nr:hypothetical protein DNTS_006117 [Danionella translucida]TRY67958.1 hypothetical protein DNTS_006117 [Danionella translucida]TRY67961.1 hypothetical protein DNTS_006117 [Danionella translucida]